jgi:hypothetical protein
MEAKTLGRKKVEYLGKKLGVIKIIGDFQKNGHRKFLLKCDICGSEKEIWYSQYANGNWNVCEHDAL